MFQVACFRRFQEHFIWGTGKGPQGSKLFVSADFWHLSFWEPGKAYNIPGCILGVISGTCHLWEPGKAYNVPGCILLVIAGKFHLKAYNVQSCMLQVISETFHFGNQARLTMFQVAYFW